MLTKVQQKKNRLKTCLAVGVLVIVLGGCAATPTPDPWQGIEIDETPAVQCDYLPDRPIPDIVGDRFTYDRDGINQLDEYFILAEACYDIQRATANQVDELKSAAKELVQAGQSQRRVADLRQQIIEDERRQHWLEKAGLYVIMLFGLGAAAL